MNINFYISFLAKHIKVKVEDSFQYPLVLKVEDNPIFLLFMLSLSLISLEKMCSWLCLINVYQVGLDQHSVLCLDSQN